MPRFPITENQINKNEAIITGPDYKHIVKVLRLNVGDQITLFDTTSTEYYSKIREIGKWDIFIEILQSKNRLSH